MQETYISIKRKIINPTQVAMTASTILQSLHGIMSAIIPVIKWILLIIYACYFLLSCGILQSRNMGNLLLFIYAVHIHLPSLTVILK